RDTLDSTRIWPQGRASKRRPCPRRLHGLSPQGPSSEWPMAMSIVGWRRSDTLVVPLVVLAQHVEVLRPSLRHRLKVLLSYSHLSQGADDRHLGAVPDCSFP